MEAQEIGDMATAEREPVTEGLGWSPQRGPGAELLIRGQRAKPPEAESFEAFAHLHKAQKAVQGGCLSIFQPSGRQGGKCLRLLMSMGAYVPEKTYYVSFGTLHTAYLFTYGLFALLNTVILHMKNGH